MDDWKREHLKLLARQLDTKRASSPSHSWSSKPRRGAVEGEGCCGGLGMGLASASI